MLLHFEHFRRPWRLQAGSYVGFRRRTIAPKGAPTGLGLASIPQIPNTLFGHRPTLIAHLLYRLP